MTEISRFISSILVLVILVSCVDVFALESTTEIVSRLQVLEDREEIRALLIEYGSALDERDFKRFSELFAKAGGEWSGGFGTAQGPAQIRKLMEKNIVPNPDAVSTPNIHIFNNEVIEVNGDRGNAVSKWMFVIQGEDGKPDWVYLGHYRDTLIREDGRWKFLQRRVTGDIPAAERR